MMNDELKNLSAHHSSLITYHLPRLYPLTDRTLSNLTHAEQTRRLIAGGARLIQIREKHATPAAFYEAAREALGIARACGAKIIINDRADIALALRADGVHFGQDDLPTEAARGLLGDDAIIGVSTHNIEQAQRAARLPVSYIAIGPIFHTSSKENPDPVVGLDGLRQVRASIPAHIPLVAIGGITEENAREVIAAGADSIAVISAVLLHADKITQRTRAMLARLSSRASSM
jgi:thiamine-phosphate pyrophosphorylase